MYRVIWCIVFLEIKRDKTTKSQTTSCRIFELWREFKELRNVKCHHPLNHISCQMCVRGLTCNVSSFCYISVIFMTKQEVQEHIWCSLAPITNNHEFKLNLANRNPIFRIQFTTILLIGIYQKLCYGLRVSVCGRWGFLNSYDIQPSMFAAAPPPPLPKALLAPQASA